MHVQTKSPNICYVYLYNDTIQSKPVDSGYGHLYNITIQSKYVDNYYNVHILPTHYAVYL